VFEELSFGTELTGEVPATGVFDPVFKPALMTEDDLVEQSKISNKAIYHSVRSQAIQRCLNSFPENVRRARRWLAQGAYPFP
jgi:hypothetical protein